MNIPKLFAFDLDGTLLNDNKELTEKNINALYEMSQTGAVIALASGRISNSMKKYTALLKHDVALLTLNGAMVYRNLPGESSPIYNSTLDKEYADFLIQYSRGKKFCLNYYIDDKLYGVKEEENAQWYDLYFMQTKSEYNFLPSFDHFEGKSPSKIIFVGDPKELDSQEEHFRSLWGDEVYICRTWDYYLEFLNKNANKGKGIEALANVYNILVEDIVAFGDAPNDIPMLQKVGLGIAMKNADPEVKAAAHRVSQYTNDEDGIAFEWDLLKKEFF